MTCSKGKKFVSCAKCTAIVKYMNHCLQIIRFCESKLSKLNKKYFSFIPEPASLNKNSKIEARLV